MNVIHPETKIKDGITMIFRGTFLGIPVYSSETTGTDTTTPDATVMVRHEEIAE